MSALIKHWMLSKKLRKLINFNTNIHNINNLYWYDLKIKFAISFKGFLKVFFWRIIFNLRNIIIKPKNNTSNKDGYSETYQHESPKNYGVENIYHSVIDKKDASISNPTIWNCKTIKSSPLLNSNEWSSILENNVEIIKKEFFSSYIKSIEHPGNKLLTDSGTWSSITLIGSKGIDENNSKSFPKTIELLKKMPICKNFGFVSFSKLSPNTHIKPHTGSTNLRLRYHLGIYVPEPDLVKIRVGGETCSWLQDKCIIFDDSYEHEVFHTGKKDRIVLMVDLWHQQLSNNEIKILSLPEFKSFGKI